jgi:cysteine-rich secretory family protein
MMRVLPFCAMALLLVTVLPAAAILGGSTAEKQIFDQLNQERQKAGLAALEWNELVAEAARRHATMLAENGELSHQFPGEPSLPERLGATGARFTSSAENIARMEHVEDVHLALMNSPGHRANILSPKYNAAGIGVVERQGRVYVAQDFAFVVPAYSEAEFSTAFAEGLNESRKASGFRPLETRNDAYFHDLACSTDGEASSLAGQVSGSYVVVFNSSEPHRLPEKMQRAVAVPGYRRISFGVCFRPDKEHGYGNFWVVAAFGS